MPAPTLENGFQVVPPVAAPSVSVPETATFSPGVKPSPRRKTARRAKAVSSDKEFESLLKRKQMKETLDRNIKEMEAREDRLKKASDAKAANLRATARDAVKKALRETALYKKRKAQIDKQITRGKTRRAKTLEGLMKTRRATVAANIRNPHIRDAVMETGGRR
jgi:hypothetical protein